MEQLESVDAGILKVLIRFRDNNSLSLVLKSLEDISKYTSSLLLLDSEDKCTFSFIAKSPVTLDLLHVAEELAKIDSSLLITGERACGKELFSRYLHIKSKRADNAFVCLNCNNFNEHFFNIAQDGTLFLREVGELSLDEQNILLNKIQSEHNIRFIASSSKNLEEMIKNGTFKSELYYRLNLFPLNIPPLRQRKDDIEVLAKYFLTEYSAEVYKKNVNFTAKALELLNEYSWPGNVSELKNVIKKACINSKNDFIDVKDLSIYSGEEKKSVCFQESQNYLFEELNEVVDKKNSDKSLKNAVNNFKKVYVKQILEETKWNQTQAAKILGIQRTYLSRLLNELDIR